MTMLDDILALAERLKTPSPAKVKMCKMVERYFHHVLPHGDRRLVNYPSLAVTGIPIVLNDEIPPDRIVWYDQYDDVFHVQMIDMEAVLAWNLAHPT